MKNLILFLKQWLKIIVWFFQVKLKSDRQKNLEILALRSQLAIVHQNIEAKKIPKANFTPAYRAFWVLLSKFFSNWKDSLVLVKPETVVKWHRTAFKMHWRRKSKKLGRPKISIETINLIKKIHQENPLLSTEKIYEKLVELGITDAPHPNTIAKYIPKIRNTPTDKQSQSWQTFLTNHSKEIWAMDFLVVPTLNFKLIYVLLIVDHHRRKIVHFAASTSPSVEWIKQQIRNATPFDQKPKYLIHDNDTKFRDRGFQLFLKNINIISKNTTFHSPWQNGICERLVGIVKQDLFNHIIPLNEKHLHRLLSEYVNEYYNPSRTHQGIDCRTPIKQKIPVKTCIKNTKLEASPVLGGLYHNYTKKAA